MAESPKQRQPGFPQKHWGVVVVAAAHLNMALLNMSLRCCDVFYLSWMREFDTSAKEAAAVLSIMNSLLSFCGKSAHIS